MHSSRQASREPERSRTPPRYTERSTRRRSLSPRDSSRQDGTRVKREEYRGYKSTRNQDFRQEDRSNRYKSQEQENKDEGEDEVKEKEKPNYEPSGLLAKAANTTETGTVLKYTEPKEARKPKKEYRLYIFKGSDLVDEIPLGKGRSSYYLFGRDRSVADIPTDHPSCSKQHAVIQFRAISKTNEYGDVDTQIVPYVMDLGSANGTTLNGSKLPKSRYVELKDKDLLKFGQSSRDYVFMFQPDDD